MNATQAFQVAGALVVGAWIAHLLTRKGSSSDPLPPGPEPMPTPDPGPAPSSSAPRLLTGNPLPVSPGRRYRVIMNITGLLAWAANEGTVADQALGMGFSEVRVTRGRPADFPGKTTGDYYIEGKWAKAPGVIPRPTVPGVTLVEAWEG